MFLVGNQIVNLTTDPSFGHNLCFRCLNEQYEPILDIYVLRAFQWYKEWHKALSFDPWNRSLKFWESTGTPYPKMGVALGVWVFTPSHSLTLSYILESMWCDSRASSWPAPLQPLCLTLRLPFGPHPCSLFALTLKLPLGLQPCNPFALVASPKLGLQQLM
jgi:hypothetical protein